MGTSEVAIELTMPSIGLTMNWLIAMRSKSARMALTSWSIESLPDTAARAIVLATAPKLFVTAFSIEVVASVPGPLAKSASALAAAARLGSPAIGMLLHHAFEFAARERRGAAGPARGDGGAPFRDRHRPENRGRQAHRASAELEEGA